MGVWQGQDDADSDSIAARLPVKRLRQGFAAMVLLTGAWVLWRNLAG